MRDINQAAKHLFSTGEWYIEPKIGEHRHGNVHFEVLAVFDHDYLGTHAFCQVWDHSDPNAEWNYVMWQSYHVRGDWPASHERGWQQRITYEWGTEMPSYKEVGEIVDLWVTSPEAMRFLCV